MYEQLAGRHTKALERFHDFGSESHPEFNATRSRLDVLLPVAPYVTDEELAGILKVAPKTIANRRALNQGAYPPLLNIAGHKKGVMVRADVLDWLAREEIGARNKRQHRVGM